MKTYHSSHKSIQINSKVKNAKTKKPQKPTSQNNVKYIPSICIALNLFHIFFLQKSFAKMTLLQNIYFYLRSHREKFCFSFMVFTFCSKGLKGHNGENATLEVAFFLHFPFRMNCLCMYRIFVSLHPFAFHYTPPPNPSSRPCPSPQLHLTLSAFHACSLLFTPLSPSTLSSEQE